MKIPTHLEILATEGRDIVPMSTIAIIREFDAADYHGVQYQIKLVSGDEYDFTDNTRDAERTNLSIYMQLHPEEFK